jgi:uroporphyrinogen-III synthase
MTILVTRPSPAGEQLVSRLRALGRVAFHAPLIDFAPGNDLARLPQGLAELQTGDLVFALSQHAVSYASSVINRAGLQWPGELSYYAIGRTTALAMHRISSLPVDYPREREISEMLLMLPALQQLAGKRALIMRGNGGRELLGETLAERGAAVSYYECYQRSPVHYDGSEQSAHWQRAGIDTLVVTSGEMLQQLYTLVPDYYRSSWLLRCRLIVVSERLATLAQELGWSTIRVAENADNDALIRALQ